MSHTTILHIYPNDKVECGEELSNSWGSAPYIWDFMIKKYIRPDGNIMYSKDAEALWKLWNREDIPACYRVVLMMTFDRFYVLKENYKRAANDIRGFLNNYDDKKIVNHWHHIADMLENNPDVPAIGLWCTSVSDNPFNGEWDEEKEEHAPPNWEDCHEVYDVLDGKKVIQ